eukprot:TRINITY_DN11511_c0_g1_i1.p1 TRINITY_DN11511_c0_g1~~TRINITY_DN11511_c0_g1_i1.p1  ORF type:complete len:937 (+),score=156.49 TRINITY_DN11511_c0_g1_i1:51-2861(+)
MSKTGQAEDSLLLHIDPMVPTNKSFAIGKGVLDLLSFTHDSNLLESLGGVSGLLQKLDTDAVRGISSESIGDRKMWFGSPHEDTVKYISTNQYISKIMFLSENLFWGQLSLMMIVQGAIMNEFPSYFWIFGTITMVLYLFVALYNAMLYLLGQIAISKTIRGYDVGQRFVIRDGQELSIGGHELLVGDVIVVKKSDYIFHDCLIIEGDVVVRHDSEDDVPSTTRTVFAKRGSIIADGSGKLLLYHLRDGDRRARKKRALMKIAEKFSFTAAFSHFDSVIRKVGLGAAVIAMTALLVQWLVNIADSYDESDWSEIAEIFVLACLVYASGLPLLFGMISRWSTSISLNELLKGLVLVRDLLFVEKAVSVTAVMFGDSLVESQTRTVSMMTYGAELCEWPVSKSAFSPLFYQKLLESFSACRIPRSTVCEQWDSQLKSSQIANSLSLLLKQWGVDFQSIKPLGHVIQEATFNREKEIDTIILEDHGCPNREYAAGNVDNLLELSTTCVNQQGDVVTMTQSARQSLKEHADSCRSRGYSIYGFAFRSITSEKTTSEADLEGYTFVSMIATGYMLQTGLKDSIELAHSMGISLFYASKSSVSATRRRVLEINPAGDRYDVVSFRDANPQSFEFHEKKKPVFTAFGNASALDRVSIVDELLVGGHLVAYVGDQNEDSVCMERAFTSLCAGLVATEVARRCSDAIVMNDSLKCVLLSIRACRVAREKLEAFSVQQLTANIVAIVITFISGIVWRTALSAVQIMWTHQVLMCGVAMVHVIPTRFGSKQGFRKPHTYFVENYSGTEMARKIIRCALSQVVLLVLLLLGACDALYEGNDSDCGDFGRTTPHYTMVFNTFALIQILRALWICLKRRGRHFFKPPFNLNSMLVIGILLASQYIIVTYGGDFFATASLNTKEWIISIIFAILALAFEAMLDIIVGMSQT